MRTYMVTSNVATINVGLLKLTERQASRRANMIKPIEGEIGVYSIKTPCQFKNGETFGYDGEFNKAMGLEMEPVTKKKGRPFSIKKD